MDKKVLFSMDRMSVVSLKILIVEDGEADFLIIERLLAKNFPSGLQLTRVIRLEEACQKLGAENFDLILLDLALPDCRGITTVEMVHSVAAGIPIIVVSGLSEEEFALQCLQAGAQDFLLKGKIEGSAILRAVRYAIERQKCFEREKLVQQLRDALTQVRVLSGLLPICAACKRIRNDQGYWAEVDTYIEAHSSVQFSHGICPECATDVRARMKSWLSDPPPRSNHLTVAKNEDAIVFSAGNSES